MVRKSKEDLKRMLIAMPKDIHTDVKVRAAIRNISITEWVRRAIVDAIKKEQQYE